MIFISLWTHFHEREHKYYHTSITLYMTMTYQSIRTSQSETHRNYLSILKYRRLKSVSYRCCTLAAMGREAGGYKI